MSTTIENCGVDPTLVRAVIRQLGGRESLPDVVRHGADAGYPGFTYYRDTCQFFRRHRKAIVGLIDQWCDESGDDPVSVVANFGCLENDRETRASIARCLYGRPTEDDCAVENALAWFALEEVALAMNPEL